MKRLMFVAAVAAVVSCANAEDSFFGKLLSVGSKDAAASSEGQGDSEIAKLNQQIKDLTDQIENAKNMPQQKLDELKAKLKSLQDQQTAKVDELKKQLQTKLDAEKAKVDGEKAKAEAKVEAEKAKVEETKKSGEGLLNSVKGLFN